MIRTILYNYFGFNKQQRRGLLMLCLICFALLMARIVYPYFISAEPVMVKNLPLVEHALDSAEKNNSYLKKYNTKKNAVVKLAVFDPNTVLYDELLSLGFSQKTARIFLKYRSKGFVFKQKQDLKKVFGISDDLYTALEPYIFIKNAVAEKNNAAEAKAEEPVTAKTKVAAKIIELNSADSLALLQLNGIGPAYAKRILKYRSLLGGFVNAEQLKEVYGFTEELYQKIKPQITLNPAAIKKINLGKDDFKSINKHPYLSYELTKSIFDWKRKTNITKDNIASIINDDALLQKLIPYLEF